MTQAANQRNSASADFDRPLLLTARQDLLGYVGSIAGRALLLSLTAASVLAVLLIFAFIARESLLFFTTSGGDQQLATQPKWDTLGLGDKVSVVASRVGELVGVHKGTATEKYWRPTDSDALYGALPMILGTLYVTLGALVIAVPLGLLAAVVLSDIVPFGVRQIFKPIIELLAAIPSVAFGFFALLVVSPILQDMGLTTGRNALNASVMLGIMAIPTIVSVSEDSLTAIGRELREASYALGATRAETVVKVIMPAAHNGILAAVILGMMRAIGETMVVWMAAGNMINIPTPWWDLSESVRTLTATVASDMGESPAGSIHRSALFAIGLLLLVFTFVLNLVTEHLVGRVKRPLGGKR